VAVHVLRRVSSLRLAMNKQESVNRTDRLAFTEGAS